MWFIAYLVRNQKRRKIPMHFHQTYIPPSAISYGHTRVVHLEHNAAAATASHSQQVSLQIFSRRSSHWLSALMGWLTAVAALTCRTRVALNKGSAWRTIISPLLLPEIKTLVGLGTGVISYVKVCPGPLKTLNVPYSNRAPLYELFSRLAGWHNKKQK